MYFWRIDELTDELSRAALPERESFKYLVASMILYSLALIPMPETSALDIYSAIAQGAVTLLGLAYVYRCNNGSEGRDFLQRYFSLGWVVGVRWTVLVVVPAFVVYFVVLGVVDDIPDDTTVYDVVILNLIYILYFWRFGAYTKAVAGSQQP